MKIVKTANKKTKIVLSKKEWKSIGRKAGWMKMTEYQVPEIDLDKVKKEHPDSDIDSFKEILSRDLELLDYVFDKLGTKVTMELISDIPYTYLHGKPELEQIVKNMRDRFMFFTK